MRTCLYLTLLLLLYAQRKARTATESPTLIQTLYQQALKYNDPLTQIFALHQRLAMEGKRVGLRETLATTYFQAGLYRQCISVSEEILQEQPKNADVAELRAASYFYLQEIRKALEAYEELYEITQSPSHLYQIVSLQFNLQRYGECQANIDRLLASSEADKITVRISTPDGQTQEVPVKAAAWNVRGVLYRLQKEEAKARSAFEEALKLFPSFILAKGNLEDLIRSAVGEKKESETRR